MFEGKNVIGGKFFSLSAKDTFEAIDPSYGQVYGVFPNTPLSEVKEAVDTARTVFPSWRQTSRVKRAELFDTLASLLKEQHDCLVETISLETGKNKNESHAEVIEALHMCQLAAGMGRQPYGEVFASEIASKDAYVVRKPRGVVAIISPWNFPLAIGSFWCAAPAIVEGNTVVHKPSELTPFVNEMVAHLYQQAGFPPGVFNLIHGGGQVGYNLVRSDVDVVLFTGSAEVGRDIRRHCANTFSKTCSIECGSKSAMMVFKDGDLDLAVDLCLASAFKLSGQRCVSSGRILVEREIADLFIEKFEFACINRLLVAGPEEVEQCLRIATDNPVAFGPLISAEHKERVKSFNQMARDDQDVEILVDDDISDYGNFLGPFVYSCEWADKPFLKQEVFGPHVAIIPFDDVDDAVRIYNDTPYGLSLGVVTDDYRKHRYLAQECATGMLYINGSSIGAESHLPFSSWKKSGWGASAASTWKAVTHTMAVTTNYAVGDFQFAQGMK